MTENLSIHATSEDTETHFSGLRSKSSLIALKRKFLKCAHKLKRQENSSETRYGVRTPHQVSSRYPSVSKEIDQVIQNLDVTVHDVHDDGKEKSLSVVTRAQARHQKEDLHVITQK